MVMMFSSVLLLALVGLSAVSCNAAPRVVCVYKSSWTTKNYVGPTPDLSKIKYCTHILYEFGVVTTSGDINPPTDKTDADLAAVMKFKVSNKGLKIILSLGIGQDDDPFGVIVADPSKRHHFVVEVTKYMAKKKFDGLNIFRHTPLVAEKTNFGLLTKEIKTYWHQHHYGYILSIDVTTFQTLLDGVYDWATLKLYVDSFNVMAFEFYHWDDLGNEAGLHTALQPSPMDPTSPRNVKWMMSYFNGKLPYSLINLMIATFGTSFALCSLNGPNPYIPQELACGAGNRGPQTDMTGMLSYHEICDYIRNSGWTSVVDPVGKAPYAYAPRPSKQWVGYEDPTSAILKVKLGKSLKVGGIGVYDLVLDDSTNICKQGFLPILTAIYKEFMHK